MYIGCTNEFVKVEYNPTASVITCIFQHQWNTTKLCSVVYGPCHQNLVHYQASNTSNSDTVLLNIKPDLLDQMFCYIVTASNGTFTIMVEGTLEGKCVQKSTGLTPHSM